MRTCGTLRQAEKLREELRRMREAAGLMRRELADLLGLEVEVVKLAEAGRGG